MNNVTIHFLYGRRESLTGKSEAYKKSVRAYLESFGYSQITDSSVEGTFEDMLFCNPTIAPGKKFLVEVKAEDLSLRSCKFAKELTRYFRLWHAKEPSERFNFHLFVQAVKKPDEWEAIFSENNQSFAVRRWCNWYNTKCLKENDIPLSDQEIIDIAKFFSETIVTVGNSQRLEIAVCEKESKSASSISKMAQSLLSIVEKRRAPTMKKSNLIMNILPISLPPYYYTCQSSAESKTDIYEGLKGRLIPPFIWRTKSRLMMSFVRFDRENPLTEYAAEPETTLKTKDLQSENPPLCSELVNVHLRRIIWNRGVYRDGKAGIFYFPMLDKSKIKRMVMGPNKKPRWVVRKLVHLEDSQYGKKGEPNFFFHRAVELETPTYWGDSYVELTPRKYYTFDGETAIDGETRKKLDAKFRNPQFDRCKTRLGLMRLWKYVLFESKEYAMKPEKWFDNFRFGHFIREVVDWSPKVIDREQTRLWDFGGK